MRNSEKLRIVDICAYFCHEAKSGGQERVNRLNSKLARHCAIQQFSFTPVLMNRKLLRHNKGYSEAIHNPLVFTAAVIFLKLFRIRNYDFAIPATFRLVRPSAALVKALAAADILQVEHPWLVSWVKRYTRRPIVLAEHNVEIDLHKDFFAHNPLKSSILHSIEETEKEAVRGANLIFSVSEENAGRLEKLYTVERKKIMVIPNGCDVPVMQANELARLSARKSIRQELDVADQSKLVLFVGSDHPPNQEAVRFIEERLAPALPNCTFLIIGGVRPASQKGNLIFMGPQDLKKMEQCIAACDVAINPVNSGSGTNLKLLRYLAAGLPTISSPVGVRGIPGAIHKKNLIISRQADFLPNIKRLINDAGLCSLLSKEGRRLSADYDWGKIADEAFFEYRRLLV